MSPTMHHPHHPVLPGGGGDGWCRRHSSTMVTRHYVLWVQQCPRLCTVVSSTVWMTVRGGGRRCVGFGWAKQQVPSPWGENQFKPCSRRPHTLLCLGLLLLPLSVCCILGPCTTCLTLPFHGSQKLDKMQQEQLAGTIALLLVDSGRSNVRQYTVLDHGGAVTAVGLVVYHLHSGDVVLGSILGLARYGHHTWDAICFFMLGLTISPKIHFGTSKNSARPPWGGGAQPDPPNYPPGPTHPHHPAPLKGALNTPLITGLGGGGCHRSRRACTTSVRVMEGDADGPNSFFRPFLRKMDGACHDVTTTRMKFWGKLMPCTSIVSHEVCDQQRFSLHNKATATAPKQQPQQQPQPQQPEPRHGRK